MNRKIVFVTGTRADYGKMKSLMLEVEKSNAFDCYVFITGMHTLKAYGDTRLEVLFEGFTNTQVYMNQIPQEPMDLVLANTINGFSRYVKELDPDLIVIHGDRVETLAAAIVGALNNIRVGHVEGGEISGAIDESIRHAVSKLSHMHFVSNQTAKDRLIQLGENQNHIFVTGSPDLDILSIRSKLSFADIKQRYTIRFDDYIIVMFHPVSSEFKQIKAQVNELCKVISRTEENFIVIYPNNDPGSQFILDAYETIKKRPNVMIFPSIRFEYFIEMMRHSKYIIGNSSAGIHEAPFLGIPSINIGSRQNRRFCYESIVNSGYGYDEILTAMEQVKKMTICKRTDFFGEGNSSKKFMEVLEDLNAWKIPVQKTFIDATQEV